MRSPVRPFLATFTLAVSLLALPMAAASLAAPDAAPVSKVDAAAPAKKVDATPVAKTDAALVSKPDAALATSQTIPVTVDEAVGTFQGIVKNFTSEHVRAGIAGIICLIVFLWRRFLSGLLIGKIPSKYLPLLTTGVAFLAALPIAIATDPWSWKTFLWQGLITGAESMALWSVIFKFIFPIPEKK